MLAADSNPSGGNSGAIPPVGAPSGSNVGGVCVTCQALVLKVVEVTITSGHHLLKDEFVNWKNDGTLYTAPDWELQPPKSNPISHTMGTYISLQVIVQAEPQGQAEQGRLAGYINNNSGSTFDSGSTTFSPGMRHTLNLVATKILPKAVLRRDISINWSVQTTQSYQTYTNIGNSQDTWFITIDKPIDGGSTEDGVTLKRMSKAVELVEPMKTTSAHAIVKNLIAKFPQYTLRTDPSIPADYNHPKYLSPSATVLGGAWLLVDDIHPAAKAECQAICRFARGVLHQIGCPGTIEVIVVWADPEVGGGDTVLEGTWGAAGTGLNGHQKIVGSETWFPGLADSPVTAGSPATGVGLNAFEACLKLTAEGTTKYYGGGVGGAVFDSKEQVITVFTALAWFTAIPDPVTGVIVTFCRQVVKKYR
jgi:hypothetical protein